MNAQLVENMPYLATIPSCRLYLRQFGDPSGGTSFKDWSPVGGRTLTSSGASNSTTQTKFTPASLYVNGSGYVRVPYQSDLACASDFVIAFWVYPTAYGSPIGVFLATTGSPNYYFFYYPSYGLRIIINNVDSGYPGGAFNPNGGSIWQHYIITKIGATVTVYKNGTSVYSSGGVNNTSYTGDLIIGAYSTSTYYLTGYIDEFCLFSSTYGVLPTAAQLWAVAQQRRLIV